ILRCVSSSTDGNLIFIAYCSPSKPIPYMSCISGTVDENLWHQPNKMERRQIRIQLQTKSVLSRSFLSCRFTASLAERKPSQLLRLRLARLREPLSHRLAELLHMPA